MGKNEWYGQELKVEKNSTTTEETTEGDREIFTASLMKDKDGVKTSVTIRVTQPAAGRQHNPLDKLLIGQAHDIMVSTNQTTLTMPDKEDKKK